MEETATNVVKTDQNEDPLLINISTNKTEHKPITPKKNISPPKMKLKKKWRARQTMFNI